MSLSPAYFTVSSLGYDSFTGVDRVVIVKGFDDFIGVNVEALV